MRGEEVVWLGSPVSVPEQNSLVNVGALRGICMPWVTTNRYWLVRCVRVLVGVRNSWSVLWMRSSR